MSHTLQQNTNANLEYVQFTGGGESELSLIYLQQEVNLIR